MGQVYTDSAIKSGHVPKLEDFTLVLSAFRDGMSNLHNTSPNQIPGATVFGSVVAGTHTVCSDIDIIVLVDDRGYSKDTIFTRVHRSELFAQAVQLAETKFVQVSVYPVSFVGLQSTRTKNDRQFFAHVMKAMSQGGLLCGTHEAFRDFCHVAPHNTLLRTTSYIERKVEKLEQRLFCFAGASEEERARMYLDTYQAPFHALRRLFELIGQSNYEDSKDGLIRAFRRLADERCVAILMTLRDRWKEYVGYVSTAHIHHGEMENPFVLEDVHGAILVLSYIQEFAEKSVVIAKR